MGTTPNYGWPYPEPGSTVDIPRDVKALAQAADASVKTVEGNFGAYVSYTPVFTSINVGNGVILGRYRRSGNIVVAQMQILAAATSPTTAFSGGSAYVTLPLVADPGILAYGHVTWNGRLGLGYVILPAGTHFMLHAVRQTDLVVTAASTVWGTAAWPANNGVTATVVYSTTGALPSRRRR